MLPALQRVDHVVLTVASVERSVAWYRDVLGAVVEVFSEGRVAASFGTWKLNFHPAQSPFTPHAAHPIPGAVDLCLLSNDLEAWLVHCDQLQVPIIEGPVIRTGATGPIRSIYLRDPDANLIEIGELL